MFAVLWIPAFAGMTGDSGNDGGIAGMMRGDREWTGEESEWGICRSRFALGFGRLGRFANPAVFVRIRIYGIGGIFRISFRADYAFRITQNHAKTGTGGRLPVEGARLVES